jgi:hypothetical protein
MDPMRIRVTRIMDFGTIVSIIGIDTESNKPVVVHVDHRPFQAILESWKTSDFSQPISFDADRLTLNLNIDMDDGDDGEQIDDEVRAA